MNTCLKHLDLSWNGFGNEGALALGEALKFNNTLVHLNLNNNRITNEGIGMLCRGLEHNDTLQILQVNRRAHRCDITHFKTILYSCLCSFMMVAGLQLTNSRGSTGSADCGQKSVSERFGGDRPMREFYVRLLSFYFHETHSVGSIRLCQLYN